MFVLLKRKTYSQQSLHQQLSHLNTYWARLYLCWTLTKGFIFTALSCVVWAEVLGSLLRTGRKTDSGWELLMQVPTKNGDIGVQSHYLKCPNKGLEALANYVQCVI